MAKRLDIVATGADTIVGAGVKIKGDLNSDGDIIIDGTVTGDIKAGGSVSLGVNAIVKANVSARSASVAGQLKGNITATDTTVVLATGKVTGNIKTDNIAVELGGIVIGTISMPPTHSLEEPEDHNEQE